MSQSHSVIFKPLKKRLIVSNQEDDDNQPFTISSSANRDNLCLPNITITTSNDGDGDEELLALTELLKIENGDFLPEKIRRNFDYANLAYKPLEEIDKEFENDETFLVISGDGKVHRFSGKKSFLQLSPFHNLRKVTLRLHTHPLLLPLLISISLFTFLFSLLLLPLILTSRSGSGSPTADDITNITRVVLCGILFLEIIVGILARGILVAPLTFLRSPKDWLFLGLLLILVANLGWDQQKLLHSLEGIVLLKLISVVPGLKTGFEFLVHLLRNLVPAMTYSFLTLWVLVILGFHSSTGATNTCDNTNVLPAAFPENYTLQEETLLMLNKTECGGRNNSSLLDITFITADILTFKAFGGLSKEVEPHFLFLTFSILFGTIFGSLHTTAFTLLAFLQKRKFKLKEGERGRPPSGNSPLPETFIFHPLTELLITSVICLDAFFISFSIVFLEKGTVMTLVKYGQEVCMILYLSEFLLKLSLGRRKYLNSSNWAAVGIDLYAAIIYVIHKVLPLPLFVLNSRLIKIISRCPPLQQILYISFKSLTSLSAGVVGVLLIGLASVRIMAGTYSHYADTSTPILSSAFSSSFLWRDWTEVLNASINQGPFAVPLATWTLELLLGVLLTSVIFVSVITTTFSTLPTFTGESDSYLKLKKALQIVCKCVKNRSSESDQVHEASASVSAVVNNGSAHGHFEDAQRTSLPIHFSSFLGRLKSVNFVSITMIVIASSAGLFKFSISSQPFYYQPKFIIDLIFVLYFLLLLLWKLVKNNFKSLKSPPWLLDLLIVSASGFTIYYTSISTNDATKGAIIQITSKISSCKSMMLIAKIDFLKVAAKALTALLKRSWALILSLLLLWTGFLLLKESLSKDLSPFLKIWDFLFHIFLTGCFVGVLTNKISENEFIASFMTTSQCSSYKEKGRKWRGRRDFLHLIPPPKKGLCLQVTHFLTFTQLFELSVILMILCDCLVITFSHLTTSKDWGIVWSYEGPFILAWYSSELLLKLAGWRKYFWKCAWNSFDFLIVLIGLIDILFIKIQLSFLSATTLRFLRVLRIFHLPFYQKRTQGFYHFLLRVLPLLLNLLSLFLILLLSFATLEQEAFTFRELITLPFFGNFSKKLSPDFLTFLAFTYLIFGTCFSVIFSEILKEAEKVGEKLGKTYLSNGGSYLRCEFLQSPDLDHDHDHDLDSGATMLTPIDPLQQDFDLEDDDGGNKSPVRINCENGYILHVEATLVTTV